MSMRADEFRDPNPGREVRNVSADKVDDGSLNFDVQAVKAALIARQQEWVLTTVRITLLAAELFEPGVIEWWMKQPNKALGGRVPATLIAAGNADEVERLLQGLADGVMG